MPASLETTNLLLAIMAAVSVLEMIALIVVSVMAYRLYQRTLAALNDLEERQIGPLVARVNGILADLKDVTARVSERSERVDLVLRDTIYRVDETAERVRASMRTKADRIFAIVKAIRVALETVLAREMKAGGRKLKVEG